MRVPCVRLCVCGFEWSEAHMPQIAAQTPGPLMVLLKVVCVAKSVRHRHFLSSFICMWTGWTDELKWRRLAPSSIDLLLLCILNRTQTHAHRLTHILALSTQTAEEPESQNRVSNQPSIYYVAMSMYVWISPLYQCERISSTKHNSI